MKRLLALMLCAVSVGVGAQGEYSLTVEEYAVDSIPGHTTYRVYVNVVSDDDVIAASCLTAVGQCTADFDFKDANWGISPDPTLGEILST